MMSRDMNRLIFWQAKTLIPAHLSIRICNCFSQNCCSSVNILHTRSYFSNFMRLLKSYTHSQNKSMSNSVPLNALTIGKYQLEIIPHISTTKWVLRTEAFNQSINQSVNQSINQSTHLIQLQLRAYQLHRKYLWKAWNFYIKIYIKSYSINHDRL